MENEFIEFLFKLSGIIIAITTILKFFVTISQKAISTVLKPISQQLSEVIDFMADSKTDRIYLHDINKNQDIKLTDHEYRIDSIEKWKCEHKDNHKRSGY